MSRSDICLYLGPADRAELEALRTNRNTPRKLIWRAGIVLATADGVGTVEIMRHTGMSKPTVWRWQDHPPGVDLDRGEIPLQGFHPINNRLSLRRV